MIPLALTAVQQSSLNAVLHSRHRTIRCGAQIMDMQERVLWDVSDKIIDGQVTQSQPENGAHRALSLTVFDPGNEIHMDLDVTTGQVVPPVSFLARATYGVWLPDLEEWIDVPVHTGPVTSARRQGDMLELEAQSMERQLFKAPHRTLILRKNWFCNSAIRAALGEAGQTRFNLLPSQARLQKDITIGPFANSITPWGAANRIARILGVIIIADGSGTVRTRPIPGRNPDWTFTDDEMVESPVTSGDSLEVVNRVEVRGAMKGSAQVWGRAQVPASHALSSTSLARNGMPQRYVEWVEDDSIQTKADADKVAKEMLDGYMAAVMEVEATVLANPLLERHDMVQLPGAPLTRFRTGTIPLGLGVMGFNSSIAPRFRKPVF